jgi:hypothetical protein
LSALDDLFVAAFMTLGGAVLLLLLAVLALYLLLLALSLVRSLRGSRGRGREPDRF